MSVECLRFYMVTLSVALLLLQLKCWCPTTCGLVLKNLNLEENSSLAGSVNFSTNNTTAPLVMSNWAKLTLEVRRVTPVYFFEHHHQNLSTLTALQGRMPEVFVYPSTTGMGACSSRSKQDKAHVQLQLTERNLPMEFKELEPEDKLSLLVNKISQRKQIALEEERNGELTKRPPCSIFKHRPTAENGI